MSRSMCVAVASSPGPFQDFQCFNRQIGYMHIHKIITYVQLNPRAIVEMVKNEVVIKQGTYEK